ncbi:MAG TPA: response regulator transcription factor [Acidimicrobiales bacterium]|jgi:two-component system NarL family response regulator
MTMVDDGVAVQEDIRVLIVDDHALFRRGLVQLLLLEDGIDVVGEGGDGEEGVRRAEELVPDVVLMDVRMPRVSGIEATRHLAGALPAARILMLTVSDEEDDLYEAIKAGAAGYLLKEISVEEVADAVRAVMHGQTLISPSMASKLIQEFNHLSRRAEGQRLMSVPRLTEREMDVLKLVARGLTNRDIADDLYISENTVKNHVRNILDKLHLHSRMEAVLYAVKEHMLDLDDGEREAR